MIERVLLTNQVPYLLNLTIIVIITIIIIIVIISRFKLCKNCSMFSVQSEMIKISRELERNVASKNDPNLVENHSGVFANRATRYLFYLNTNTSAKFIHLE